MLANAKFDVQGAVTEALIPWVKRNDPKRSSLETVLMGRIRLRDRKLTVEVNSAGRARTLRALIEQTLGSRARYRRTRKQPLDEVIPPGLPGPGIQAAPRTAAESELMQLPEVRAQLEEFQRRHYERWPDIPLPALQGRTPLEAVRDRDGREIVAALINQFERDAGGVPVPTSPEVFAALRRRLGLTSGA